MSELWRSALSGIPVLGEPPQRISVSIEQVRELVAQQFPQWNEFSVEPVRDGGWDNYTFRLGKHLVVRQPSAAEYALAVEKEQQWLPRLAPQLPLPIPVPIAVGQPGCGYPYAWSVYEWIDGVAARPDLLADPIHCAEDLAAFVDALHDVDATAGPQPGVHNWYRGGTLLTFDHLVEQHIDAPPPGVGAAALRRVWDSALRSTWDGVDRWFHGDLSPANLLLREGHLTAVIDFGTCGVGDPACDLAIAWTLFDAEARATFRRRLNADDTLWARGRGWALWKTLSTYVNLESNSGPTADECTRVLAALTEDTVE